MPSEKLRVYFTVDTETSLGGAWRNAGPGPLPVTRTIFGDNGSGTYGVPLIMDILEQHNFRATFFVEVFCSYLLGKDEVGRVFECIQKRGHDVQLHLHPVYRFYRDFLQGHDRREKDLMFQFPLEEQTQLIREGVGLFREFSGKAPRAFRAGCYGASEVTLAALRENDVLIDSSYNLSYLDQTCGFQRRPLNAPQVLEGIYEFPVTNFNSGWPGAYKPLEISAVSTSEILSTIRHMQRVGCTDVVLVFHSFSFLKRRGVRFEKCRPDRIVIQRFRNLCVELWRMREEIEVSVLGDVYVADIPPLQPQVVPSLGWLMPAARKAVQGLDHIPWV
jgi:peptidoglycan/xylan/chitin deacetylase (PgdA/CDA1 family)